MIFMVWLFVPRALALEKQLELRDYAESLARNQVLALREGTTAPPTFEETGPEGVQFVVSSQVQTLDDELKEGRVEVRWAHRGKQQSVVQQSRWLGVGFP